MVRVAAVRFTAARIVRYGMRQIAEALTGRFRIALSWLFADVWRPIKTKFAPFAHEPVATTQSLSARLSVLTGSTGISAFNRACRSVSDSDASCLTLA